MPSLRRTRVQPLVAVLVGAAAVVGLIAVSDVLTSRIFDRAEALDELTHELRSGAVESHLWLEERLAGDTDPTLDERIGGRLADARDACAALPTGAVVGGTLPFQREDAAARATADRLCDRLEELSELTAARLDLGAEAGSGSELDVAYDGVFDEAFDLMEEVEELVHAEMARGRTRLRMLDLGLIVLASVAFALMAVFVHRAGRHLARLGHQHAVTLDAVPHAVARLAPDGTVTLANRAARQLLPDGDACGTGGSVEQMVEPCDAQGRPRAWADTPWGVALRGGVERVGDARGRRPDGTSFVAACTLTPIVAGDPDAGAVLVVRDVTGTRALERERDELASIAIATSELALIGLPDGRLHWLNPAARDVLGFGPDEDVSGYRIEDVFSPEELERVYRDVMPVVVDTRTWQGELVLRDREGTPVPVWASMDAHHDERGERRYVSCLMRDLRDRLAEEARLRESERRLDEAQQLAQLGSWELDMATGVVDFSAQMHRIYGTDPATFAPTFDAFLGRVLPEDVPVLQRDFAAALEGDGDYQGEFRIVREDGELRTIDARGIVTYAADGHPSRMVGTNQDVTELRQVEQLKRELISVVSHELRTPLTSIHGALRLLQTGLVTAQPDRAARMVDIAESNTERLIRLVNDILDVERLASGRTDLDVAPVEVDVLVPRAVAVMRPMADAAEVTLEADVPPLVIEVDADRFVQVLTNLLSNAIKFSPAGATVQVAAALVDDDAELRVSDAGRGIPADQLEQVFGRFNQVDPSDARERGGTGLGLAICRGLIEQHGGRIWAESEPGHGATFVVRVPPHATSAAGERPLLASTHVTVDRGPGVRR